MDPRKIIKKYIMPGFLIRGGAVVLAVVLAVTLVMGIMALNTEVPDPVEFYHTETPTGTMAYIDVVGISNWLYQYEGETYYTVWCFTDKLPSLSDLKDLAASETGPGVG